MVPQQIGQDGGGERKCAQNRSPELLSGSTRCSFSPRMWFFEVPGPNNGRCGPKKGKKRLEPVVGHLSLPAGSNSRLDSSHSGFLEMRAHPLSYRP